MEMCFVERGTVWWWAGSELYEVSGGQAYVTWPHELHGGLHGALNPCKLYWLGVPLWPRGRHDGRTFLELPDSEAAVLVATLAALPRRHFPVPVALARSCDLLLEAIEGASDALAVTRIRTTLLDILLRVIEAASNAPAPVYSMLIRAAMRSIDESLDRPLSVPELSRRLGWSPSHVQHRFRDEVGVPPAEWQLRRRVGQACRVLERTDEAITRSLRSTRAQRPFPRGRDDDRKRGDEESKQRAHVPTFAAPVYPRNSQHLDLNTSALL